MNIAMDIRTINKPKSGVGYYVSNLLEEIIRADNLNQYCLISNDGKLELKLSNFNYYKTWISNENHIVGDLWENLLLPVFLRQKNIDVFHGPAFMIPMLTGNFRTVATIYDIVAYIHPETVPRKYALYMKVLIKMAAKRADKVITTSLSTKNDLVKRLNVPEKNIQVIYGAATKMFAPLDSEEQRTEIKRKFGIRDKYMFFVGNLEPRKNLVRLMEAFHHASQKLGEDYQLVICGKNGWLYKDIFKTYERLKGNQDIILTNYVGTQDLLSLYQAANMFVFPTLYEGFGLPPLEAMACGVPVITSNLSSLPEVVGEAAITINPFDVGEISDAMVRLASSETLRKSLIEDGLRQAKRFTWEKAAQETIEVYHSLA